MTIERSGGGDPARTLVLLWREPGPQKRSRGKQQGLTVDRVLTAAVELADAEGLEGLSMRAVAQRLGVSAMSLYTYVPAKAELLDLMVDSVYAGMPRTAPGEGWQARLEAIARENLALYERHPWLVHVSTTRPPLGPGVMAKYEYELAALEGLGLSDVEMDATLTLLLGFVHSTARSAVDAAQTEEQTAITDEQWWEGNAPLLGRFFRPACYPLAARVGAAAGAALGGTYEPTHAFEFGLRRLLDGLGVLIAARQPRGRQRRRGRAVAAPGDPGEGRRRAQADAASPAAGSPAAEGASGGASAGARRKSARRA